MLYIDFSSRCYLLIYLFVYLFWLFEIGSHTIALADSEFTV